MKKCKLNGFGEAQKVDFLKHNFDLSSNKKYETFSTHPKLYEKRNWFSIRNPSYLDETLMYICASERREGEKEKVCWEEAKQIECEGDYGWRRDEKTMSGKIDDGSANIWAREK